MLSYRYDLVVRNDHGNLVALVEIKNAKSFPIEFAASLAEQMLEDGALAEIPYLLVVSQDIGFLWRDARAEAVTAADAIQFDMVHVLDRYLHGDNSRRLVEDELVLRVQQWLIELSLGRVSVTSEPDRTLAALGFLNAIRGGLVTGESYL
ncbi:MAG TPA: hypothetical protein VJO13_08980 [Ktedonobacterales bacterium]|nr:hypothetical protein [Ktedonobacterales bacterium]